MHGPDVNTRTLNISDLLRDRKQKQNLATNDITIPLIIVMNQWSVEFIDCADPFVFHQERRAVCGLVSQSPAQMAKACR